MGATSIPISPRILAEQAEEAIREFDRASDRVSEALAHLQNLQRERPTRKTEAIVRLCTVPHPVTGKNYSPNQAEDVLQLDQDYSDYKERVSAADMVLREAKAGKRSAWLSAKLAIAQFKAAGGLT